MPASAHDFEFASIDGKPLKLSQFAGKPVLVVNTASECGLTPQYAGLQALSEKYAPRGLVVLGVPSNDFGGQEPGTEAEIKSFCATNYKVTFPMTAKNKVVGAGAHPLYKWAAAAGGEAPKWNFHKYLIGADGTLAATFGSKVPPGDPALASAIEAALAKADA
jgi:glutathione peroxidase